MDLYADSGWGIPLHDNNVLCQSSYPTVKSLLSISATLAPSPETRTLTVGRPAPRQRVSPKTLRPSPKRRYDGAQPRVHPRKGVLHWSLDIKKGLQFPEDLAWCLRLDSQGVRAVPEPKAEAKASPPLRWGEAPGSPPRGFCIGLLTLKKVFSFLKTLRGGRRGTRTPDPLGVNEML